MSLARIGSMDYLRSDKSHSNTMVFSTMNIVNSSIEMVKLISKNKRPGMIVCNGCARSMTSRSSLFHTGLPTCEHSFKTNSHCWEFCNDHEFGAAILLLPEYTDLHCNGIKIGCRSPRPGDSCDRIF